MSDSKVYFIRDKNGETVATISLAADLVFENNQLHSIVGLRKVKSTRRKAVSIEVSPELKVEEMAG